MTPPKNPPPKTLAGMVLLDEDHSGRDEMNLAGNPFALLSAASKTGQPFIKREWERRLANGKIVTASWEVNGHAELGLPGPNEELLYLVLLQLTREQKEQLGAWPKRVHFTRRNLLVRMGWGVGTREYRLLSEGLKRLQAAVIQTRWSFFDARVGGPVEERGFSLVEEYLLHEEKTRRKTQDAELPFSYIEWSSVVYDSLCAGNVRSLALDFALSLEFPISRRLFRLLELLRHAGKPLKTEVSFKLFDLRDRLGMTPYKFPSQIRQTLAPAIEELQKTGYLGEVVFSNDKKTEMAAFHFGSLSRLNVNTASLSPVSKTQTVETPGTKAPKTPISASSERENWRRAFEIWQGLSESEKTEIRSLARRDCPADFWERLENPDSPMSVKLWEIVLREFGERN